MEKLIVLNCLYIIFLLEDPNGKVFSYLMKKWEKLSYNLDSQTLLLQC